MYCTNLEAAPHKTDSYNKEHGSVYSRLHHLNEYNCTRPGRGQWAGSNIV